MMRSERATFAIRIAFSAAAAVLILAGASLNAAGRGGGDLVVAWIAGFMAVVAGAAYSEWTVAGPMAVGSLLVELLSVHFQFADPGLPAQLGGLLLLVLGGVIGITAYRSFTDALRTQLEDMEALNAQLGEKHRAFVAATSDVDGARPPADAGALTAQLAHDLGATFACCYLAGSDGRQYLPQPPGIGLGRLHPQPLLRGEKAVALAAAIDAGKDYVAAGKTALQDLVNYVPDELEVEGLLAVPMPIGARIGGFILLGNRPGGFTDDDRRLAMTLTRRAGAQLASAHAVAMSQQESARYTLMGELVKEASGKTTDEVLSLVMDRVRQVVSYDAGRIALFQPDSTYVFLNGSGAAMPLTGPLKKVQGGETLIRNHALAEDGAPSGVPPNPTSHTVNEALSPIRGKAGVIGAICLGRSGATFNQREGLALTELGSMAGIAVENSQILQAITGQATKRRSALDALGEISQALTTVTQGALVLEQKTLETAARVTGATAALLTRTTPDGNQRVITSLGFPAEVNTMVFANGQGIVGAVMLSQRVTALADASTSFDLSSPPDLLAYGLHSALCAPMLEDGRLWGTLSVFDVKKRDWIDDDQQVLSTLGNQGVVAVGNAELYEKHQRTIWELTNLQEALQAATSTIELSEVLQEVVDHAANASSAQIGCLALEDNGYLVLKGAFGTDAKTAEKLALGLGGDICRDVMASGKPLMEAMTPKPGSDSSPLNPRAVLCVPIRLHGKQTGVVFLANYQAGRVFTDDHRILVTELADQASVHIDNARLFKDREDVMLSALEALANAVDARDPYTAGHSQRVTQYALMIARQMRYSPKDQAPWVRLERGVRLHDIGKIGVPDAVLQKPGKLTDQEFTQMKAHTTIGFDILSGLKMLTDELVIVRSHHERYDGKGYPDRLKGDQLPMFAWIASAADAIDAMTSDRPYRKGMSLEVALDQVRQGAGTHFHPDVAEAVLDAAHNGTLTLIEQESMYRDAPAIGAFENPVS